MATDFSISEFLAWARTKPADEVYNFCLSNECALAQFGIATGRLYLVGVSSPATKWPDIGEALNPVRTNASSYGHTFGELVERLEALLPAPVISDTWTRPDAYLSDLDEQVSA